MEGMAGHYHWGTNCTSFKKGLKQEGNKSINLCAKQGQCMLPKVSA